MKKRLTEKEFIAHVLKVAAKHGGQNALAQKIGVGNGYMSDVVNGRRKASARFAAPFGFHKETVFISHK